MVTSELQKSIERALEIAYERGHEYVGLEHLLLALLDDADAKRLLQRCEVDLLALRGELETLLAEFENLAGVHPTPTTAFQRVLQRAVAQMRSAGREQANGANVLVSIMDERQSRVFGLLEDFGLSRYRLTRAIAREAPPSGASSESQPSEAEEGGVARNPLEAYCTDLTAQPGPGSSTP